MFGNVNLMYYICTVIINQSNIMKVIKKFKGCYLIYIDNIFVGWIDKLENVNEWVCYDKFDKPFEICNTKKYALTQFKNL